MNHLPKIAAVYSRIREILDSARTNVARSVNTTQVVANWLIGREIVEEQQRGRKRADYGERLMADLSTRLQIDYGKGYSIQNLKHFRDFYLTYEGLLHCRIRHAVRGEYPPPLEIGHALRGEFDVAIDHDKSDAVRRKSSPPSEIRHALRGESSSAAGVRKSNDEPWRPGQLNPNLAWTHYRTLLRVEKTEARSFYEIEAIDNNWSARELERQINSLLYERLALSKDKKGLMRLAKKGQEILQPANVFKDPVVIEFLGLPESPRLVESDLETALLDNLQAFLLELGKGFAFVARQQRLTLDGDHFYIALVFYHTILKCFVLIDLKTGKLTHKDLGELQLYVNYYDRERLSEGDNPTLGLILCTDKNDAVVKYTLGQDQSPKIFASRYKLFLPSEDELREEIRREVRKFPAPSFKPPPPKPRKAKKT